MNRRSSQSLFRARWLLGLLLALCAAPASAQLDIFIRITPTNGAPVLPGTSTDGKFPGRDGWSLVDGFSLGAVNDAGSRVSFVDLVVNNSVNANSPAIFQALASGRSQALVELAIRRSGSADGQAFLLYDLKTVQFTAQHWGGSSGVNDPAETLRMTYAVFRIRYRPQNPDGTLGSFTIGQWNTLTGTPTF